MFLLQKGSFCKKTGYPQIVLLGFCIGISENKDVVSYLLFHFKNYLQTRGKTEEFIDNIKFMSDSGTAILSFVEVYFQKKTFIITAFFIEVEI